MLGIIVVALIITYSLKFLYGVFHKSGDEGLPPGPVPLPLVGNLLSMNASETQLTFHKWGKTYGPIFRVYFGPKMAVVLNSIEALREGMLKQADVFAGRPKLFVFDTVISDGRNGIAFSDGDKTKELRRFTLSVLRDFGAGKGRAVQLITMELDKLLAKLDETSKKCGSINPSLLFKVSTVNVIMRILFDKTFEFDDPIFSQYQHRVHVILRSFGVMTLYNSCPWLRFLLPGWLTGFSRMANYQRQNWDFIQNEIENHKTADMKHVSEANDYTGRFLIEMKRLQANGSSAPPYNENNLRIALNEMYVGGFETTVSTLLWALLFLSKHPDVQEKMADEILSYTGQVGKVPDWEDRNDLPYTGAVLYEIQRVGSILPLGVFHRTMADTTLGGFNIPADCIIVPNLYSIVRDERLFPNPERFDPSRYLSSSENTDEQIKARKEAVVPFGIGKRACIGEALAKMELFLFLVGIVATYKFSFPSDQPEPTTEGCPGFTRAPKPFSVILSRRNSDITG